MKVLCFVGLLLLVAAIQDNAIRQGDIEIQDDDDTSSLGRAILSLASLQSKSYQVDFTKLLNALDELETSIVESREEEVQLFQSDYTLYVVDINFYQNQVTQFTNEVASHHVEISELQDAFDSLEKKSEAKRQELVQFKLLRDTLAKTIAEDQLIFKEKSADFIDAISAVDQAIDLLEQSRSGSFIETSRTQATKILLETRIQKLGRFLYQPLIDALVEVSYKKFSDKNRVAKVINLLNDLRQDLNEQRVALIDSYTNWMDSYNKLAEQYEKLIQNSVVIIIPRIQHQVENTQGELITRNTILNDAIANLGLAQENFDQTESAWILRQAENNALIKQYTNELFIVSSRKTILDRAGIRRQS